MQAKTNVMYQNQMIPLLTSNITGWHYDPNLIDGSTDKDQFLKLIQEVGELSDNLCQGKCIKDDIGDIIVVLINIAERNKLTIEDCLLQAWNDIKDRKGTMRDGIFIKENKDIFSLKAIGITQSDTDTLCEGIKALLDEPK